MSFQFRFEKILTMKEKEKESALNEMNVVKRIKESAENQLLDLIRKKDGYEKDYQRFLQGSITITDMKEREQYLLFLNKQIEKAKTKVFDITREFNLKKTQLLTKNQEEKMWSTWREKSFEEYTEKVNREEQNLLDEMAVVRYFHQNTSSGLY
ncbi:flagellar export protein FliJ [Neobacillus pocheonensis]|uniref:flagellar export protein FliJ n=1 Tax=Neobacillus pocheonensis TaxID=363869 RepID=UPI003D281201